MWERKELKQRAKACLKLYYWPAVLVVLIASVLGGSSGFTMPAASGGNVAESVETITELPEAYPSIQSTSRRAVNAVAETIQILLAHKLRLTREQCREFCRKINARL